MSKEFFKNLPDTSTPLNASRLNGLLNGNEAMGNIVVGDVKCKNLFNKNNVSIGYIYLNNTEEQLLDGTNERTSEWISCKPNTYYTIQGGDRRRIQYKNSSGTITYSDDSQDTSDNVTFLTLSDTVYFRVYLVDNINNTSLDDIQIEEGTTATDYVPYKAFGIESGSNDNGSWIKYDDGTLLMHGEFSLTPTSDQYANFGSTGLVYLLPDTIPMPITSTINVVPNVVVRSANFDWTTRLTGDSNYIYWSMLTNSSQERKLTIQWSAIGRWK